MVILVTENQMECNSHTFGLEQFHEVWFAVQFSFHGSKVGQTAKWKQNNIISVTGWSPAATPVDARNIGKNVMSVRRNNPFLMPDWFCNVAPYVFQFQDFKARDLMDLKRCLLPSSPPPELKPKTTNQCCSLPRNNSQGTWFWVHFPHSLFGNNSLGENRGSHLGTLFDDPPTLFSTSCLSARFHSKWRFPGTLNSLLISLLFSLVVLPQPIVINLILDVLLGGRREAGETTCSCNVDADKGRKNNPDQTEYFVRRISSRCKELIFTFGFWKVLRSVHQPWGCLAGILYSSKYTFTQSITFFTVVTLNFPRVLHQLVKNWCCHISMFICCQEVHCPFPETSNQQFSFLSKFPTQRHAHVKKSTRVFAALPVSARKFLAYHPDQPNIERQTLFRGISLKSKQSFIASSILFERLMSWLQLQQSFRITPKPRRNCCLFFLESRAWAAISNVRMRFWSKWPNYMYAQWMWHSHAESLAQEINFSCFIHPKRVWKVGKKSDVKSIRDSVFQTKERNAHAALLMNRSHHRITRTGKVNVQDVEPEAVSLLWMKSLRR